MKENREGRERDVVSQIDFSRDGRFVDCSSCQRLGPHRDVRGRYKFEAEEGKRHHGGR
jgi:hypothetical protein